MSICYIGLGERVIMKKIFKVVPNYAWLPLFLAIVVNCLVYNGSKVITDHLEHYDFSIFLDGWLPFLNVFIVIYILAYLQWGIGYIVISRESKEMCHFIVVTDVLAKMICLFFFLVVPTYIVRPTITSNDFFSFLTQFIYKMDDPVNLFPSIHCLESYMVFRGCLNLNVSKRYKIGMGLFTVLVCLSTVFVKQHVVVDIIGGICIAEFSYQIVKRFKWFKK